MACQSIYTKEEQSKRVIALEEDWKPFVRSALEKTKGEDIVFSVHAGMRAAQRGIDRGEVLRNLQNPSKLLSVRKEGECEGGKKFRCIFDASAKWLHAYVMVINNNLLVVTVYRINKKTQKRVEKNAGFPV